MAGHGKESKETGGFVAVDSKGDSVPFGTRLSLESLVCYTFMQQTEYGNGARSFEARSVSVFFFAKGCSRGGRILSKEEVQAK